MPRPSDTLKSRPLPAATIGTYPVQLQAEN